MKNDDKEVLERGVPYIRSILAFILYVIDIKR